MNLSRVRILRQLKSSLSARNTPYTQAICLEVLQRLPQASKVRNILRQSQRQADQRTHVLEPLRAFIFPLRLKFYTNLSKIANLAEQRLCQNPEDINAHKAIAYVTTQWKDWDNALDTYNILRSLCGDTFSILSGLSKVHEALGNEEEHDALQRLLCARYT